MGWGIGLAVRWLRRVLGCAGNWGLLRRLATRVFPTREGTSLRGRGREVGSVGGGGSGAGVAAMGEKGGASVGGEVGWVSLLLLVRGSRVQRAVRVQ